MRRRPNSSPFPIGFAKPGARTDQPRREARCGYALDGETDAGFRNDPASNGISRGERCQPRFAYQIVVTPYFSNTASSLITVKARSNAVATKMRSMGSL